MAFKNRKLSINIGLQNLILFHIEAYDWNCPRHIIPRYTVAEIEEAFASQHNHIARLEAEIKALKAQLF